MAHVLKLAQFLDGIARLHVCAFFHDWRLGFAIGMVFRVVKSLLKCREQLLPIGRAPLPGLASGRRAVYAAHSGPARGTELQLRGGLLECVGFRRSRAAAFVAWRAGFLVFCFLLRSKPPNGEDPKRQKEQRSAVLKMPRNAANPCKYWIELKFS